MAKYNIYSSGGSLLASGYPKYNAAYGKPAYLEFNISSPTVINFAVGSYVDWRDGRRYKLYSVPEPMKQAGSGLAGDAFVYQNLQFHDQTKELENLIFTDLVLHSGSYFFSSRESTSTYEDLDGIMARIEACLDNQSGETWYVQKVSGFDSDADLSAVASEPHEFSISGQSILEACNQVTEIFKGVGWIYEYDSNADEHYIYFGGPNVRTISGTTTYGDGTTGTFLYGKGNGLVSIKKYITNKDKLCTRLYAYGNERNMPLRWYNNQSIYQAANVDIPNLMIPMSEWGTTTSLPNAQLAYINNGGVEEALYGLIPRRVYFNNEENGDIYPSIKGITIGDVVDAYDAMTPAQQADYMRPDLSNYDESERVDEIVSATNPSDNGDPGDSSSYTYSGQFASPETVFTASLQEETPNVAVTVKEFDFSPLTTYGDFTITPSDYGIAYLIVNPDDGEGVIYADHYEFEEYAGFLFRLQLVANSTVIGQSDYLEWVYVGDSGSNYIYRIRETSTITIESETDLAASSLTLRLYGGVAIAHTLVNNYLEIVSGSFVFDNVYSYTFAYNTETRARVVIPQIGFDLNDVTATNGAYGTINMLDGMCGGRAFTIRRCTYDSDSDSYSLIIDRVQDDSTGMYYPNSIYTIDTGDHYVLTDIYMPDMYVAFGAQKLLAAAEEYYALNSTPKYLYTPEIDSSKIADGTFTLPHPGMYMALQDTQITGGVTEYVLIDSVTVAEGDSNIPVISITLRERLNVPSS